jgi:hypothetical protein
MEIGIHNVQALLVQLGVLEHVDDFIATHHLPKGLALGDAHFWNPVQAEFIRKAHDEDAQWSAAVDELAARLS